ncbi:FAD-binding oxidoreductase [Jiangella asiatica]|uniref:FAD-binding protein n=1 Tax=Jiangella asiatica TaxID=2530372 RepID=A0A4V2Z0M0_9ACTN|nr:FAD-binding protein [Jiangella asiatica]TDE01628.1 FAD-binding protein [Jiangella asiatica]
MSAIVTTYRPADLAELRDALTESARAGQRLAVAGTGTAQWGGLVDADAVVDTTAMTGLISYNPTDMTVAVRAGTRLADLQEVLAEHRQWVALDPARATAEGGTVGGIVATADAGPSRHQFGGSRDSVIGMTVVLADGTVARSGGHVIKNVAGYDLAKLFHGCLGTLGVVAEVVLRVHPRPAATATLAVACPAREAFTLGGRLIAESLEPAAVEWTCTRPRGPGLAQRAEAAREQRDGTLLVRFDGTTNGVADRLRRARALAGEHAAEGTPEHWQKAGRLAVGAPGDTVLRLGTAPDQVAQLVMDVDRLAATHAVDAAMTSTLFAGVHTVRLRDAPAAAHAAVVESLRMAHSAATVCRWAPDLRNELAPWGDPPPAVSLLRAVKRRFDPDDRLCPGRFAPWF